jgi:hypothetical protein
MNYCAKCGSSVATVSKIQSKYIDLGGPLQRPNSRKVCSSCKREISEWIKAEVITVQVTMWPN